MTRSPTRKTRSHRYRILALILFIGMLVTTLPGEIFGQDAEPGPRGARGPGIGRGPAAHEETPLQQGEARKPPADDVEEEKPRTLSRPIVMVIVLGALSLLAGGMLLGRLELFTVLVLFSRTLPKVIGSGVASPTALRNTVPDTSTVSSAMSMFEPSPNA